MTGKTLDLNPRSVEEIEMANERPAFYRYPLEYIFLIQRNPLYRLYIMSHLCQHVGDWFIRIASLLAIERLAPESATALSGLVVAKMIPQVLISQVGGSMADVMDRRLLLIVLDTLGAVLTLGFLIAISTESLPLFYFFTALRASVHALYEPTTKAILPMLVTDSEDLKRAMTVNGMVWSLMLVVGGSLAGGFSAYLGIEACYVLDSITYFISALVIMFLKGDYSVSKKVETKDETENRSMLNRTMRFVVNPIKTFCNLVFDVMKYLWRSGFGMLILMKGAGSIVWGASDILNVSYAEIEGDEIATGRRLGLLYSCMGIGCFLGPIVANFFTDPDRPKTFQFVCVVAMAFMTLGWFAIGNALRFGVICAFTAVKTIGSAIIWINSSLLLQQLTQPQRLGRVMGLEFAVAMLCDALSATIAGRLIDYGYSPNQIAIGASGVAATMFLFWSTYHMLGKGAAKAEFNRRKTEKQEAQVVFA